MYIGHHDTVTKEVAQRATDSAGILNVSMVHDQNTNMHSAHHQQTVLVTGACGHIGSELCRLLRSVNLEILPSDIDPDRTEGAVVGDLRSKQFVSELFRLHSIHTVIHLAGILPSAFQAGPLAGAEANLT